MVEQTSYQSKNRERLVGKVPPEWVADKDEIQRAYIQRMAAVAAYEAFAAEKYKP